MTVEAVESRILKQVEFYFGDANLPRDKFLLERVQENEEGWVLVDTIASFARVKKLSENVETIKAALSQESSLIELSEDKTMVRRKTELPKDRQTLSHTLYVKGFPTDATLEELEAFFAQHSSQVEAIRFRRHPKDHSFKGSVFVEFASEEEATRFSTLTITYNNATPLVIKTKMAYFEDELAEKQAKKSGKSAAVLDKFGRGCLVRLSGFPADISVDAVKEALRASFPVAYVDYTYEPGCAWIRFREPLGEQFAEKYSAEELILGEHKVEEIIVASEEEQSKYYETVMKPRDSNRKDKRQERPKRPAEEEAEKFGEQDEEVQLKKAKTEENATIIGETTDGVEVAEQ